MARQFTDESTNRIATTFTDSTLVQQSYSIWFYRTGQGAGAPARRLIQKTDVGTSTFSLHYQSPTATIRFQRLWTTQADWGVPIPGAEAWHHIAATYDASSTANDPIIYIDGASQVVTELTAPSGTLNTSNTDVYSIGNKGALSDSWTGYLAEAAIWSRILTTNEMIGLSKGYVPTFYANSLVTYLPLIRELNDLKRGAGTATGTTVVTHPRMIYPE